MPKQTTPPADTTPVDTPPSPQQPKGSGNRFFSWIRSLGLVRQPGWIGGVSVGIADRLGIDVLIVRGILVVVAVFGGPALLLYAAAWLILPDSGGKIHLEEMLRGRFESPLVGIAILVALSVLPVAPSVWSLGSAYWGNPYWGDSVGRAIWTLVVLALLVGFIVWFSRRARPTAPPSPPTADPASNPDAADDGQNATTAVIPTTPATTPNGSVSSATVPNDQVADWREGQAQWKSDHEEFRKQQATERIAASQAAAAAAKAERIARAAADRENRARTRSNPLYSAALIGAALIAGAVSALALGNGSPNPIQYLQGAAVAVGVLGIGIIVNGAIGRRSGGATAIAILLLIPLALGGMFPQTSTLRYSGDRDLVLHSVGPGTTRVYTQLSGNVTLDLSHYFSTPRPKAAAANYSGEEVHLLVGSGNVKVIVPADEYEYVSGTTLSGSLTTLAGTRLTGNGVQSYGKQVSPDHDPNQTNAARELVVEVNAASGNITFVEAPAIKGAAK